MVGRKADPNSRYRVYLHKDKKYKYGAVQEPVFNTDGVKKYKVIHIGKLDDNNVFHPNFRFKLMPLSERSKYIFPNEWDISEVIAIEKYECKQKEVNEIGNPTEPVNTTQGNTKSSTTATGSSDSEPTTGQEPESSNTEQSSDTVDCSCENIKEPKPSDLILDQYNNKLYGSFWILEKICKNCGLYEDLCETFEGNILMINSIISLAFYPYLSGKAYNRFAKWQYSHKTLLENSLNSTAITRITQNITDHHRMTLIKLRLKRQPEGALLDCDSTTRSGWGKCIVELCWGNNKDNPKLQNTVESYVYSLSTHEPIYYRSFPEYTNDISTIRTILIDLQAIGISDVVFIADRGYPSEENLAMMVEASIPFLMCAKVGNEPISSLVGKISYDAYGVPLNMTFDTKRKIYYLQVDIPPYQSSLSDDTIVEMVDLRANLFMNPRRRADELALIQNHIVEEETILKEAVSTNRIPADIKKYNALFKYYKVSYSYALEDKAKQKPIGIAYEPYEKKIQKERSVCGFFASIMHKHDIDGLKALETYKSRDEHEKNFDILKNQMLFYNQRNSSEEGRDGRSFISFVGLIPISKFRNAWKEKMQDTFESSLDMLDEMEPIRYSQYTDGSSCMTTFTEKQVAICDACDVEPPKDCIPPTVRRAREAKRNPKKRGRKPKAEKMHRKIIN